MKFSCLSSVPSSIRREKVVEELTSIVVMLVNGFWPQKGSASF